MENKLLQIRWKIWIGTAHVKTTEAQTTGQDLIGGLAVPSSERLQPEALSTHGSHNDSEHIQSLPTGAACVNTSFSTPQQPANPSVLSPGLPHVQKQQVIVRSETRQGGCNRDSGFHVAFTSRNINLHWDAEKELAFIVPQHLRNISLLCLWRAEYIEIMLVHMEIHAKKTGRQTHRLHLQFIFISWYRQITLTPDLRV